MANAAFNIILLLCGIAVAIIGAATNSGDAYWGAALTQGVVVTSIFWELLKRNKY